jgi:NDP-hexose 2,3-enoyl reductase
MTLRPEPYSEFENERTFDALEAFEAAAATREVELAALALAWVLSHPQVTAVVVGPRRPEHLEPALAALELPLAPSERDELAELFAA